MIELPRGFLLRRPESTDSSAIVELMVACDMADSGRPDTTLEDLQADWSLPRFDRLRDAWIVGARDRAIVGYAWAWDRVPHVDVQGDLHVRPDHRGVGLEAVLLRVLEERAREHAGAAPAGTGAQLAIFAKPASGLAVLLETRGFARVRTFLRMAVDLKAGYPSVDAPKGIEIRRFRPGRDERSVQRAIEESFAGHFRFSPEPYEEWVSRRVGHPEFDPDLWLLACEGEDVAGAVLPYAFGDLGWVRELGVRPGWRGRGIGKALLLETFRSFDARRMDRVCLGVDADNASGATRLYRSVGMREEERHDLYQLTLRPAR